MEDREIWYMNLRRTDDNNICMNQQEIRLFSVMRNEELRLPYFLKHYRQLGVNRFFIIDNDSNDNTCKILKEQSDVHIFYTNESFEKKEIWLNDLMDTYGVGHWCLAVDGDELFIYPHYETIPLRKLCSYLDSRGYSAMESLFIDMYPRGDIYLNKYTAGDSLIENSPYFDPYCYRRVTDKRKHFLTGEEMEVSTYFGGTREEIFGLKFCCSKFPLFKYNKSVFIDAGMHGISGVTAANIQGAVLHFKFLFDFAQHVKEEVLREVHFCNALEYKTYQNVLKNTASFSLYRPESLRYQDSRQLIILGFMKSNLEFEEFVNGIT